MKRSFYILLAIVPFLAACGNLMASDLTPPPDSNVSPVVTEIPPTVSGPLYPLVMPNAEDGKALYEAKCVSCHGERGLGDGPQANELPNPVAAIGDVELARQNPPAEWFRIVSNGNLDKFMPHFTSLTDRQRWDVVAYVYSLGINEKDLAVGEDLYTNYCAECHGTAGEGDGPSAATLSSAPRDFTNQEFMAGRSNAELYQAISDGITPSMPAFDELLTVEERLYLADYLRTFTFALSGEQLANNQSLNNPPRNDDEGTSETGTEEAPAQDQEQTGSVIGQITNGSGGALIAGENVTLYGFNQTAQVFSDTTTIRDDGVYVFDDVEMPVDRVFITTIRYDDVLYRSEIAMVKDDEKMLELPITVYDSTTDNSALYIDRLHIIITPLDDETMRVIELYVISNRSEKTVIAEDDENPVIRFALPSEASNLQIDNGTIGDRYVLTDDGFGDKAPVLPGMGNYQTIFTYILPMERKLKLSHVVYLPVEAMVVLAPETMKLKGMDLQDEGTQNVQGIQFNVYSGTGLEEGEDVNLVVSSGSTFLNTNFNDLSNTNLLIGLGVLGLVLILSGVWFYRRNQMMSEQEAEELEELVFDNGNLDDDPDTIMDAILALDDLYREGQLPEDAYKERRAELKERLAKLLREEE